MHEVCTILVRASSKGGEYLVTRDSTTAPVLMQYIKIEKNNYANRSGDSGLQSLHCNLESTRKGWCIRKEDFTG